MAESKDELKSLLMRVKEEREKASLKLNIQKTKIMVSGLVTSWQTDGGKVELKSLSRKVKEESEKTGLKLNIQKTKIMAFCPISSWQMGKQWKQWQTLFSWAQNSLQMVIAAVKLKDACSL